MIAIDEAALHTKRKRTIRIASAIFISVLLLLTFFSSTYQKLALPKVSVEKPEMSQLSFEIEGDGTIRPKRKVDLYDQTGWVVKEVPVKKGDAVKKGQPLLVFDTSTAQKNLADEQDRHAKQQIELEKLQDSLKQHGLGGEASKIDEIRRQINALKLDMSVQARKIESIRKEIADKGTLIAPFDGLIDDLQADAGLSASPGRAVVQLSDLSQGWELKSNVDADSANRLTAGEAVDVRIKETPVRLVKGKIASVEKTDSAGGSQAKGGGTSDLREVAVDIADPKLTGKELAEFRIVKNVGAPRQMVPKTAVKTDTRGEYIFVIEEKKRPLGNEFRARKKYVTTEDSDKTNAVLIGMIMPNEKIITESSEPISDGDLVRIH